MQKNLLLAVCIIITNAAFAQKSFPKSQLSINGFRNPSIGLEYQHNQVSVHGGHYITAFKSGETTQFIKTGVTYWFLPVDDKEIPSSFYAGASYLRGLNRDYKNKNAFAAEAGFRWQIWQGLNFRIGVIAVAAKGENVKLNPAAGISYSFKL